MIFWRAVKLPPAHLSTAYHPEVEPKFFVLVGEAFSTRPLVDL